MLGRSLEYKARTEYLNGSGKQFLLLRHRPVFLTPRVWLDEGGFYGAPSSAFDSTRELTYGTDFALRIDQEDGSSRSGILIRINREWPRPQIRERGYLSPYVGDGFGNIKVTYSAGYTLDTLPGTIRMATTFLVARIREMLPLGYELSHESYEERTITKAISDRQKLMSLVWPLILPYRNHRFN